MNSRPPLLFPSRDTDSHKGDFGRVVLIGGSRGMAGSISLSSIAALKTGSGLVTALVPDRCLETVASFHPGVMTVPLADTPQGRFDVLDECHEVNKHLQRADAIGIGPGMTTGAGSVGLVCRVLQQTSIPRVLDADAINILAEHGWLNSDSPAVPINGPINGPIVLTPHPGELSRLTGVPAGERKKQIDAAAGLAQRHGIVVVVKGGPTVVVGFDSATAQPLRWTNDTGNPGMATAGSGDVLTGVITSLLGQGLSAWDASRLGVWVHGRAGDRAADSIGSSGMTCWEILTALPCSAQDATV
ncbi:NAD(P)H-hydrate dehydratase [Stieleria varia]|uniref:ADP-dependent (S)-NAD(P)H-hydrate dehydratase n=1 Tax=Stieleria varia TaxID=2528005 RepID=A0A5C6AND4_9BACT|nr:NAD(P)H-hydrate dehydratase [Stieleria varia]TWU00759.1 ATP-dependent (S)-NAD(P)H-hydrate dehydratase [Stieleria varia]